MRCYIEIRVSPSESSTSNSQRYLFWQKALRTSCHVCSARFPGAVSLNCRLPVTMDSDCAKTSSNGIPRPIGTWRVSTNQRPPENDVNWHLRNHLFMVHYRASPFNVTISNNSTNTNSITGAPGLIDGKLCPCYIDTTMVTLHKVFPESQSISNLARGCAVA